MEAWTGLWFAVLALSSFRITRLLVEDSILDRPRIWLVEHLGGEAGFGERLLSCPWCAGIWVGGATVASALLWPPSLYLHAALALAAVAGLVASADSAMHKDTGLKAGDRSEPPEETSINSGEERPDPVGALVRNLARETVHVGPRRRSGADVVFTPLTEPVTEPTPMPVNMAPSQPANPAFGAASDGASEGG